jgi:hypothetical protein
MTVLDEHDARIDAIGEHGFEPVRQRCRCLAGAGNEDSPAKRNVQSAAGTGIAPRIGVDCRAAAKQIFAARGMHRGCEKRAEQ